MIAELGLRKPSSYSELATPLLELGLVGDEFAKEVKVIARNRNMLAHTYRRLTLKELIELARRIINNVPSVLGKILDIIELKGIDPKEEATALVKSIGKIFKNYRNVVAVILFGSRLEVCSERIVITI